MASQIQHPPQCHLSNIHFYPCWNTIQSYKIHLNLASCCQPFFGSPTNDPHPSAPQSTMPRGSNSWNSLWNSCELASWPANRNDFTPAKCAKNMKRWYVFFGCLTLKKEFQTTQGHLKRNLLLVFCHLGEFQLSLSPVPWSKNTQEVSDQSYQLRISTREFMQLLVLILLEVVRCHLLDHSIRITWAI